MCASAVQSPSFAGSARRVAIAFKICFSYLVAIPLITATNCVALPALISPDEANSTAMCLDSPSPGETQDVASSCSTLDTPCKESPQCDEYFIRCSRADAIGQLIHLSDDDNLSHQCVLTVDASTCEHLRKLGKLPPQGNSSNGLVGPLLNPRMEIFNALLPPKPLTTLGVWDIDRYCLYAEHELNAHGTGKSCPNCKEEQQAYDYQVRCLGQQYQAFCQSELADSGACKTLQDSISKLKKAVEFNRCLCASGSACEKCHKACVRDGIFSEFCDALKKTYCPKKEAPPAPIRTELVE
jgi:hypothetical protein